MSLSEDTDWIYWRRCNITGRRQVDG